MPHPKKVVDVRRLDSSRDLGRPLQDQVLIMTQARRRSLKLLAGGSGLPGLQ